MMKLCQYVFGVIFVKLGYIAEIIRGGNFQKKDFCEFGFLCIHYGQIYTRYGISTPDTIRCVSKSVAENSKQAVPNDIVMAVTSENVKMYVNVLRGLVILMWLSVVILQLYITDKIQSTLPTFFIPMTSFLKRKNWLTEQRLLK